MVPILYGRQAIRLEPRASTRFLIGYVMFVFYRLSVFRIPAQFAVKQIAWVLYGQASRAISIG